MKYFYDTCGQLCVDPQYQVNYTYQAPPENDAPRGKSWTFTGDTWIAMVKRAPVAPVAPMQASLVITSVTADKQIIVAPDFSECTAPVGTTLTIKSEFRAPDGSVIPSDDAFRMPIMKRGGGEGMLIANMKAGIVTIVAAMTNPGDDGVWTVDQATINEGFPPESQLTFAGFAIKVYREA